MTEFQSFTKKQFGYLSARDQELAAEAIQTWFYPTKPKTTITFWQKLKSAFAVLKG